MDSDIDASEAILAVLTASRQQLRALAHKHLPAERAFAMEVKLQKGCREDRQQHEFYTTLLEREIQLWRLTTVLPRVNPGTPTRPSKSATPTHQATTTLDSQPPGATSADSAATVPHPDTETENPAALRVVPDNDGPQSANPPSKTAATPIADAEIAWVVEGLSSGDAQDEQAWSAPSSEPTATPEATTPTTELIPDDPLPPPLTLPAPATFAPVDEESEEVLPVDSEIAWVVEGHDQQLSANVVMGEVEEYPTDEEELHNPSDEDKPAAENLEVDAPDVAFVSSATVFVTDDYGPPIVSPELPLFTEEDDPILAPESQSFITDDYGPPIVDATRSLQDADPEDPPNASLPLIIDPEADPEAVEEHSFTFNSDDEHSDEAAAEAIAPPPTPFDPPSPSVAVVQIFKGTQPAADAVELNEANEIEIDLPDDDEPSSEAFRNEARPSARLSIQLNSPSAEPDIPTLTEASSLPLEPDPSSEEQLKPAEAAQVIQQLSQARQMEARGDLRTAVLFYSDLIDLVPTNIDARLGRGRCLMEQGDYSAAMSDMQRAEDLDPKSPQPSYEMGNLFYARKDYRRATSFYTQSLNNDSTLIMARVRRGMSHHYLREHQRALDDLERALDLDPSNHHIQSCIRMVTKAMN